MVPEAEAEGAKARILDWKRQLKEGQGRVKERSDGEILGGLIERSRLLIALSDDIPVETKLETQPLLKQLESLVDECRRRSRRRAHRGDARAALRLAGRVRRSRRAPLRHAALPAPMSALSGHPRPRPHALPRGAVLHVDPRRPRCRRREDRGSEGWGRRAIRLSRDRRRAGLLPGAQSQQEGHHARPPAGRGARAPPPHAAAFRRAGGELRRRHAGALGARSRGPLQASIHASSSPACRASARRDRGPIGPRTTSSPRRRAASCRSPDFPGNPPTRGGGSLGDYVQGLFGAIGVLGALCARARTGRGQAVDVSSQDAHVLAARRLAGDLRGVGPSAPAGGQPPPRHGAVRLLPRERRLGGDRGGEQQALPRRSRRPSDGPSWASIRDFRGVSGRVARSDEINGIVGAWVAERTVDEVVRALGPDGAGVPCSPVYTVDQLVQHPQLLAREMIQRLPHAKLGEVLTPGRGGEDVGDPGRARAVSVPSSASTPRRSTARCWGCPTRRSTSSEPVR